MRTSLKITKSQRKKHALPEYIFNAIIFASVYGFFSGEIFLDAVMIFFSREKLSDRVAFTRVFFY